MLRTVLVWALAICVGAVVAVEAVGQTPPDQTSPEKSSPQTPPDAPDMTGWYRVGELRDGQRIIVSINFGPTYHCVFRGITETSVLCDENGPYVGIYQRSTVQREIARDHISSLRTDDFFRDRAVVISVFGGAGLAYGAVAQPGDGGTRGLDAILFGAIGSGVGYLVSIPIWSLHPGKTVYVQPGPASATHLRAPLLKKRPAKPIESAQVH
jgi:hypothetical protein